MKLTVLVDNNTFIDHYFLGEPAVSYYLEGDDTKLLFDTGYSDVFLRNARTMGIDLTSVEHIVLSHGHNDHTKGLGYLVPLVKEVKPQILAHPGVFDQRYDGSAAIGCPIGQKILAKSFRIQLTAEPHRITSRLMFLGEIPSYNTFERTRPVGRVQRDNELHDDFVTDDSALVYKGEKGLFIITGCSHSGICNIIEHAKVVCRDERISGVIGGFHLLGVSEQLSETIAYFMRNNISNLLPCHCVSFAAKAAINAAMPIHEVGVGLILEL